MDAVTTARSALLYPQFWFDKVNPPPPPEPQLTAGQRRHAEVLTAEIERQTAEIERLLEERAKDRTEKPPLAPRAGHAFDRAEEAQQEPATANQRVELARPRPGRLLPTDPVERRRFEAIVDTAWDMAQDESRELERIEGLVRSNERDAVFVALQEFFHLKKPSQGVKSGDEKIKMVGGEELRVNDSRKHPGTS
jgi:hypothetical protein